MALIRTESLLNEEGKQQIAEVIDNHHMLALVYQYRLKLQAIWSRTTATQRELLEALQDWCKQAEATGVHALTKICDKFSRIFDKKKLT